MSATHVTPPVGRVGGYLPCSPADIEWAMSVQTAELAVGNAKRLGQILVEREAVSEEQLKDALRAQRFDRLRRCHFLAELSDRELTRISELAEEVSLAAGEDLFQEDQRGDSVYVVATGRMVMYQRHDDTAWIPLGIAHPGTVLGEMGYFANGTRSYSAGALEPTTLLKIRYEVLSRFIGSMPSLAVGMLKWVTNRIRATGSLRHAAMNWIQAS